MSAEALYRLRLRTPRLALRLGTRTELGELYDVAAAGIHCPDWMPFAVAWTDALDRDRFLAFHEAAIADWRSDEWMLNLLVWAEGELAGTQGIGASRFAERRTVETGSWLGLRWQGRGIGTEMRAAVLELAFRGLGATAAESGAVAGNARSLRISEKLGYRIVGKHTIAPRGEPVAHDDLRLERGDWRAPVRVEIEGLEPCLPLFGAANATPAGSVENRHASGTDAAQFHR
jgi:RimJ/RimL family protein N-acetyltransferase